MADKSKPETETEDQEQLETQDDAAKRADEDIANLKEEEVHEAAAEGLKALKDSIYISQTERYRSEAEKLDWDDDLAKKTSQEIVEEVLENTPNDLPENMSTLREAWMKAWLGEYISQLDIVCHQVLWGLAHDLQTEHVTAARDGADEKVGDFDRWLSKTHPDKAKELEDSKKAKEAEAKKQKEDLEKKKKDDAAKKTADEKAAATLAKELSEKLTPLKTTIATFDARVKIIQDVLKFPEFGKTELAELNSMMLAATAVAKIDELKAKSDAFEKRLASAEKLVAAAKESPEGLNEEHLKKMRETISNGTADEKVVEALATEVSTIDAAKDAELEAQINTAEATWADQIEAFANGQEGQMKVIAMGLASAMRYVGSKLAGIKFIPGIGDWAKTKFYTTKELIESGDQTILARRRTMKHMLHMELPIEMVKLLAHPGMKAINIDTLCKNESKRKEIDPDGQYTEQLNWLNGQLQAAVKRDPSAKEKPLIAIMGDPKAKFQYKPLLGFGAPKPAEPAAPGAAPASGDGSAAGVAVAAGAAAVAGAVTGAVSDAAKPAEAPQGDLKTRYAGEITRVITDISNIQKQGEGAIDLTGDTIIDFKFPYMQGGEILTTPCEIGSHGLTMGPVTYAIKAAENATLQSLSAGKLVFSNKKELSVAALVENLKEFKSDKQTYEMTVGGETFVFEKQAA